MNVRHWQPRIKGTNVNIEARRLYDNEAAKERSASAAAERYVKEQALADLAKPKVPGTEP